MNRRRSVGFVGLGAMGSAMATRLIDAGWRLVVYNRTAERAKPLEERGATVAATPREVASLSDTIITMVSDDAAVRAVALGENGVVAGLTRGKVYMDMSTASRDVAIEIHQAAGESRAETLDVRVSGSVSAAQDGSLLMLVGGDHGVCEKISSVLDVLGRKIIYTGDHGTAAVAKVALNILLGVEVAALSETFLLARKGGVSTQVIVDVVNQSGVSSPVIKSKLEMIRHGHFDAQFSLFLMQKDLRLALDEGNRQATPLTVTAVANQLALAGIGNGFGELDFAAIYLALLQMAGVRHQTDATGFIKEPAQSI